MKIPKSCSNLSCKEKSIGLFWIYTKSFPEDNGKLYCSLVSMCKSDFDRQNNGKNVESIEKLQKGITVELSKRTQQKQDSVEIK